MSTADGYDIANINLLNELQKHCCQVVIFHCYQRFAHFHCVRFNRHA